MDTGQLIMSIGIILLVARLFGSIFQYIGQPRVVGEMAAGIVLGPSVLGLFFPSASAHLFPASSLPTLTALSQLGLLLFMFVVGLEVDLKLILKQRFTVVLTSNVSIVAPLVLGVAFARFIYPELAGGHVAFASFALFIGTAMSVTAFPVLARILKEKNLLSTDLGRVAISCAAVDDVTAWLLLAIVTGVVHSAQSWPHLAGTMLGLVAFIGIMLMLVRPAIEFLQRRLKEDDADGRFFFVLILLMLAAGWTTDRLGVHPLFGAFMAGLVVPKDNGWATKSVQRIESVTLALLLPLFFALTGLRTRIDLLTGSRAWACAAAIIAIAIFGKLAGAALASRLSGMEWRNCLAVGVLMNTRGLVELVVLNAGLELGILSSALFTMMVIMALVTTSMTTPLLGLLNVTALQMSSATQGSAVSRKPLIGDASFTEVQ
jgi:Kef-type K+ transport system membrane component KefB